MIILIDLAISIMMASWVYLEMGAPFAVLFLILALFFVAKSAELSTTTSMAYKAIIVASDLFGLGVVMLFNFIAELTIKMFAKLFQSGSESKQRFAEDVDMANKVDGTGSLEALKESLEHDAENLSGISTDLVDYNNVFFGLNAIETTLLAYIIARLIFALYLLRRKN